MCNSFAWAAVYAVLVYYLYAPYMKGLGFTEGEAATMTTATFLIPIAFLYKLFTNRRIEADERKKLVPFLKLFCAQVVVATAAVMINSALAVFVKAKVNRNMLGITFAPATTPWSAPRMSATPHHCCTARTFWPL